jgi:DegV family protein with EDD domain
MAKIAVMTDSNSGITQSVGKDLGIRVVPMPFTINGEEYLEDISLTQEGFYEKLLTGADVSTSQPSIHYVASIWDELLEEYDEIVYIPMSSGLSESCRAAMLFADQNYSGKVFVVDNQRISITQRQSVLDAMELAEKGYTGSQIKKILEDQKMNSEIFIMVDTLKYLKKGGRITPAAAALGGALKIKPILRIKGEKLDKFHMMNRTVSNAKRIMINAVIECIQTYLKDLDGRTDNVHIEVTYSGTDLTNVNDLLMQVKEAFPGKEIYVAPLSLSVSCHIGDGAIAVACSKEIIL